MKGLQFLRDWALPHFYFHVVTAYDILRHNGVYIGKRDYLSHVASAIRQQGWEPPATGEGHADAVGLPSTVPHTTPNTAEKCTPFNSQSDSLLVISELLA